MGKQDKMLWIFLHLPKTGGTTFSDQVKKYFKKEEVMDTSQLRYNLIPEDINKDKIKVILGHATYHGIHNLFHDRTPRYIIFLRDPAERFVSSYNFEMRTKEGENILFWKWYGSQLKNEIIYFLDMKFRGKEGAKANLPRKLLPFFGKIFRNKKVYMAFQKAYESYISLFQSSEKANRKKLENARKLLDNCWHIGFINNLDRSLAFLFTQMGIPTKWENTNTTKKSEKLFTLDESSRRKIYEGNKYDKELYDYAVKISEKKRLS